MVEGGEGGAWPSGGGGAHVVTAERSVLLQS